MKHFLLGTLGKKVTGKKYFLNILKKKVQWKVNEILSLAKQLNEVSKIYSSIEGSAIKNSFINDSSNMYIIF